MANEEEGKQPSKKPKKQKSSSISPDQLQQLLKEALTTYADQRTRKTEDLCDSICSVLEEFLQSFVILGYDVNGNPVTIVNTRTQQDADALSTAVTRFFYQRSGDAGM